MQTKPPPHDMDREIAVLGAMFIRPEIKPKVKQLISSEDFYRESHQNIFKALLEVESDIVAVLGWLKKYGLHDKCGGNDYLSTIVESVHTSAGFKYHCEILKELSDRRKLITHCADTANLAWDETREFTEIFSTHKNEIRKLQSDQRPDYTLNSELVKSVFRDIEDRKNNGDQFIGVQTGFKNIDSHLYGLEAKTTTYLIARPSIGKTTLALNIADNIASNFSGKVLFFSLESGEKALTRRRMSSLSGVYLSRIRTGDIEDSQWPFLVEAANTLSNSNLIIFDRPKFKTIENLCSMAETMALENDISLIVVDHIQRMRSKRRFQNRHLEISWISEELTTLCNELNVPGLILCQLNREVEKRSKKNQRPQLHDVRESGDLEQNADNVIGLYRENREAGYAEIEGLKGRDVGTWKEWLKFDRFTQKFTDCEDRDDPYSGVMDRGEI